MQNKIKNISFNRGIVRTPGYSQADGELSECINLIPRNGELVNILPPKKIWSLESTAWKVVAVHRVTPENLDHYVLLPDTSGQGSNVWAAWLPETSQPSASVVLFPFTFPIEDIPSISITPIGNVICFSSPSFVRYVLWKDGSYIDLEDADFNLDIQFGIKSNLKQDNTSIDGARLEQISDSSGNYYHWAKRTEIAPNSITASILAAQDSGLLTTAARHTYMLKLEVPDGMKDFMVGVWVYYPGSNDIEEEFYGESGESTLVFTTGLKTVEGQQVPPRGITIMARKTNYSGNFRVISKATLYVSDTSASTSAPDEFILTGAEEGVMALVNGMVAREVNDNKFVMPFFARYGIKLTTGQIINLSAPCYLVPNALYAPTISFHTNNTNNVLVEGYFRATLFSAELYYVIDDNGMLDKLRGFEGVIESVVVMITPPVYLYDQALKPGGLSEALVKRTNTFLNYIPASGGDAEVRLGAKSWGVNYNSSYTLDDGIKFDTPSEPYMLLLPTGGEARTRLANYGGTTNTSTNRYDTAIEQRRFDALSTWFVAAEIPLKVLKDDAEWKKVAINKGVLAALYAQQASDGFAQFTDTNVSGIKLISTNGTFSYNNRLFYIGGTERAKYDWNPVRMNGFVPNPTETGEWRPISTKTSSDVELHVHMYYSDNKDYLYNIPFRNGALWSKANFIAFPDPSVIKTSTFRSDNDLVMRSHSIANMAVGFFDEAAETIPTTWPAKSYPDTLYPNKLYMSYANQPLALDRNASITFSGEIRALSVVTKALTQGQFGQFPIYVFTSDGIWMLEVGNNGVITSSHPVSRDIITQGTQPLQTDDAIFFITAQGLKKLTGSSITLVSEPIHGFNPSEKSYASTAWSTPGSRPSDPNQLLLWLIKTTYQVLLNGGSNDTPDTIDFVKELQEPTTQLCYDYAQQLVHVFMGDYIHYVYAIDSGAWAQQVFFKVIGSGQSATIGKYKNPKSIIPRYPLSMLYYGDTNGYRSLYQYTPEMRLEGDEDILFDFDGIGTGRQAVVLTRPIALEDPTTMTTLMDFRLHRLQTSNRTDRLRDWRVAVFASRDGFTWHNIGSLKRGSYKYFRFLIFSNMRDNESIQGLTALYQPRRTHKLR